MCKRAIIILVITAIFLSLCITGCNGGNTSPDPSALSDTYSIEEFVKELESIR